MVEAIDGDKAVDFSADVCGCVCGSVGFGVDLDRCDACCVSGQRVCACSSDSNSSETSRWWIFKNSGDVYTGLGVSPIAASINHRAVVDIIVFDCTAAVSQRAWFPRQPAYQHVTWLFVPWCLPSTQLRSLSRP